jgi:hypothetical protein
MLRAAKAPATSQHSRAHWEWEGAIVCWQLAMPIHLGATGRLCQSAAAQAAAREGSGTGAACSRRARSLVHIRSQPARRADRQPLRYRVIFW